MKKRLLSIITALALCLTLCPIGAFATGEDPTTPTQSLPPLPENSVDDVVGVQVAVEYLEEFEEFTYSATPVREPVATDLVYECSKEGPGSFDCFRAPEGSSIKVQVDAKWYRGLIPDDEFKIDSPPKDVGEYTVLPIVTLTVEGGSDPHIVLASDPSSITIKQKEVTPKLRTDITKPYDGTSAFVPQSEGDSPIDYKESDICDEDIKHNTVTFSYDMAQYGGDDATAVGENKPFTVTNIRLRGEAAHNYKMKDGTDATLPGEADITQAKLDTVTRPTRLIRNGLAKEYSFAIKDLLPTLNNNQQYGEITVVEGTLNSSIDLPGYFDTANKNPVTDNKIRIEDGKNLILTVAKTNYTGRQAIGNVSFEVKTTNFQNFNVTVILIGADKTELLINGLEATSPEYTGTPQDGYSGKLSLALADETAGVELPEKYTSASQLTHLYEGTHQTTYDPTDEAPIEPGRYKLTLSIPDSDPDFEGQIQINFTITRAIVTVTAIERRIKVDDPVPSLSRPELGVDYSVTGLAEGDVLRQAPTMKYATVADSISAGEFQILIDGAMVPDEDHYNPAIKYVPGKLVVTSLSDKDENPFSDVSEYAWYVTAVKYVYNEGLMKGTTNTLFSPTSSLTRGMLVTILYRMEGEPKVWSTSPFKDVDEDEYYYDPIRWANSEGIVQGYGNGRFGPNDALTREHLAIILYKYSRYNAINVNKAASLDRFVDAAHLSAEGYRALQWACAEKLIQGTGSTTLSPNDKALRAQVAVILMRYRTTVAPPPAKPEETKPAA